MTHQCPKCSGRCDCGCTACLHCSYMIIDYGCSTLDGTLVPGWTPEDERRYVEEPR